MPTHTRSGSAITTAAPTGIRRSHRDFSASRSQRWRPIARPVAAPTGSSISTGSGTRPSVPTQARAALAGRSSSWTQDHCADLAPPCSRPSDDRQRPRTDNRRNRAISGRECVDTGVPPVVADADGGPRRTARTPERRCRWARRSNRRCMPATKVTVHVDPDRLAIQSVTPPSPRSSSRPWGQALLLGSVMGAQEGAGFCP